MGDPLPATPLAARERLFEIMTQSGPLSGRSYVDSVNQAAPAAFLQHFEWRRAQNALRILEEHNQRAAFDTPAHVDFTPQQRRSSRLTSETFTAPASNGHYKNLGKQTVEGHTYLNGIGLVDLRCEPATVVRRSIDGNRHPVLFGGAVRRRTYSQRVVEACVLPFRPRQNFYYSVMDVGPALRETLRLTGQMPILAPAGSPDVLIALMEQCGLSADRVIFEPADVAIDHAHVVWRGYGPASRRSMRRAVRQRLGNRPSRRLYLSRRAMANRPLVNEIELEETLLGLDFEIVQPETLPLSQQFELVAEASVIVAPHGAALSSLIAAADELRIVELFPPYYQPAMFQHLGKQLGARWTYEKIVGDLTGSADDWTVDVRSVTSAALPGHRSVS